MTPQALPQAAIDAATITNLRNALKEAAAEIDRRYVMGAAAERERIRQLAVQYDAICWTDDSDDCPFADLLTDPAAVHPDSLTDPALD